jgi:hypothetical protein
MILAVIGGTPVQIDVPVERITASRMSGEHLSMLRALPWRLRRRICAAFMSTTLSLNSRLRPMNSLI